MQTTAVGRQQVLNRIFTPSPSRPGFGSGFLLYEVKSARRVKMRTKGRIQTGELSYKLPLRVCAQWRMAFLAIPKLHPAYLMGRWLLLAGQRCILACARSQH